MLHKKEQNLLFFLQIFANNANTKPKAKSEVIILALIVLDSPIHRDIGLILVWYLMTPYWPWLCCPLACGGWGAPTHYPLSKDFLKANKHLWVSQPPPNSSFSVLSDQIYKMKSMPFFCIYLQTSILLSSSNTLIGWICLVSGWIEFFGGFVLRQAETKVVWLHFWKAQHCPHFRNLFEIWTFP